MASSGNRSQEVFLGEPAELFSFTSTGRLYDAEPMPSDHNLTASVVLHYQLENRGNQTSLSVNNTFVPHHSEITLPEKKALIDFHDQFVTPAKAFPAESPVFGFALEARYLACSAMHAARQHILGGLALREDGVAGVFFANMLPEQIERKARLMLSNYVSGYPSVALTRFMERHGFHERGTTVETAEKTLQLIIGCGSLASAEFRAALGFRSQDALESPVRQPSSNELTAVAS